MPPSITSNAAWALISRSLEYEVAGSSAVAVAGVLRKPDAEEFVGSLDEASAVFMARHSDLKTATGVTTWAKFDKVIDGTRVYNVTEIETLYQGSTPTYVRAEVAG
jgi:hypothetical protein